MEFTSVEQLPLNLFTRLQADGRCQGQREAHIEPRVLPARTNGLHPQRIDTFHFFAESMFITGHV